MLSETKKGIKLQAIPEKFPGGGGYIARWRAGHGHQADARTTALQEFRRARLPL